MKHIQAGLLAGAVVIIGIGLVCVVIAAILSMGAAAWALIGLFLGVTIIAAIIDWKTEKKP